MYISSRRERDWLGRVGEAGKGVGVCVCVCVCSDVGEFKVGGCSSAFKCSSFTFSYLFAWHISHDICDDGRAQLM